MEQAGGAAFAVAREMAVKGARIAILCGSGNNGGDGFVVARLAHLAGYRVDCFVAADRDRLSSEAEYQCGLLEQCGLEPNFSPNGSHMLPDAALIVDALLGIGASRDVDGPICSAIQAANTSNVPILALDVPSGIDCDTGAELGASIQARRTITFGLPKPYLFQGIGVERSGVWSIGEIGYPRAWLEEPTAARVLDRDSLRSHMPRRTTASNKGANGSLLIVAGSERMRGAAILAAHAALRSGIGLVTVASVEPVCAALAEAVPEAISFPLASMSAKASEALLSEMPRFDAAVFGPGLGTAPDVLEFLRETWAAWTIPTQIDADALNAISLGVQPPNATTVITPHPGEAARLLKSTVEQVQSDRFASARQLSNTFQAVAVLKGAYSQIAAPGNPIGVNPTGNSGMAVAGMGDVLSGVLGTLLAQGLSPTDAAECGAYWHGLAGDLCANEIGPIGYTATDLSNRLPAARAKLTAS